MYHEYRLLKCLIVIYSHQCHCFGFLNYENIIFLKEITFLFNAHEMHTHTRKTSL